MEILSLDSSEYASFYKTYIDLVPKLPLVELLGTSLNEFVDFFKNVADDKLVYSYQEGKWTVKELMLHLIDAERVFQYRALRFARQDEASLPGFSENNYVPNSFANERTLESLLEEFKAVRQSTVSLFQSFNSQTLMSLGVASNSAMSVRAIGYVIIGHQKHHIKIIKERYLH